MFNAATYSSRRDALLRGLAERGARSGIVLFLGNTESPRNYGDNCYAFRQDSSFLYFFGLAQPGLAATIDLASAQATLYGEDPSLDELVWTGPRQSIAELATASGIAATRRRSELAAALGSFAPAGAATVGAATASAATVRAATVRAAPLLYLPPYRAEARAEIAALTGRAYGLVDEGASEPLIRTAIALREIKSEAEIAEIERAVATSVDMHRAALATARAGMLESDIAARVAQVALASGGDSAFPPIATMRGATLHNHSYAGRLAEGGLFLLDCGAEAPSGYAGDLTTTFPIGKRFDERQRAIYDIVVAMRERACGMLRPGLPFRDAHLAAARCAVLGLEALGIMRGDADEAVAAGAHALFFPHGLGHMMGLDVHDMENYGEDYVGYEGQGRSAQFGLRSLRLAKALKAGMVHTVEPGLYFIPELVAAWKAQARHDSFIDYGALEAWMAVGGIRSEENWLVTAFGARRLGPGLDASPAAIEGFRGG